MHLLFSRPRVFIKELVGHNEVEEEGAEPPAFADLLCVVDVLNKRGGRLKADGADGAPPFVHPRHCLCGG